MAIASIVILSMLVSSGGGYDTVKKVLGNKKEAYLRKTFFEDEYHFWQEYLGLDGYYNGVRTLVPSSEYEPQNQYNLSEPLETLPVNGASTEPSLDPVVYNPYPDYDSEQYRTNHPGTVECFLDASETIPTRDIYAYPGLPQHLPLPFYGSYSELGLVEDVCFDRFGRLGPYGLGYNESMGGNGTGSNTEQSGAEKVFDTAGFVNYTNIDWSIAQRQCFEKNRARFDEAQPNGKKRVMRHAYVLRTFTGYPYDEHKLFTMRAMINELALKSRGEYDVHLLVHVKNNSIPIWADEGVYNETLQNNVPREFWNISTLWSVQQMMMYYPAPFPDNFANMVESNVHGAYRSPHFALLWFSRQHPEYDFIWNWEMDLRYSGHYYEFNTKIGEWAKQQPRKGLWERNRRFWFPEYHGDYKNFTKFVERETEEVDIPKNNLQESGPVPIWGPVQDFEHSGMLSPPDDTKPPTTYKKDKYQWGVGEEADLLVFNPIFDPSTGNWVFRYDVTGYDRSLPIPPRRAAIITASRLSKRLLNIMHEEVWRQRHTMFPEMFASTMCLHHGLKAVYVPHPVYFDRDWELEKMNQVFNYPRSVQASPFGWGENNLWGSTFYYNSYFSAVLWRRWLGLKEAGHGGRKEEEESTGRMCLRSMLLHPVKYEGVPK